MLSSLFIFDINLLKKLCKMLYNKILTNWMKNSILIVANTKYVLHGK